MTEPFCRFCLTEGHLKADCPKLGTITIREEDPRPTPSDDALQDRCHRLRAALRGVLVDVKRANLTLSPETASLVQDADAFDP